MPFRFGDVQMCIRDSPKAGLADDAGGDIVRAAAPLEQLVADAHHDGQEQQLEQDAERCV